MSTGWYHDWMYFREADGKVEVHQSETNFLKIVEQF